MAEAQLLLLPETVPEELLHLEGEPEPQELTEAVKLPLEQKELLWVAQEEALVD